MTVGEGDDKGFEGIKGVGDRNPGNRQPSYEKTRNRSEFN